MASSTFDLGLRIFGTSKEAVKAISDLESEIEELGKSSEEASADLDNLNQKTNEFAESSEKASESASTLSQDLKKVGGDIASLGSSLTMLSAPLIALSALSLKNVFDLGNLEGATGSMAAFSRSVNTMVDNFKSLTVEIGTALMPVIQPLINAVTSVTTMFRRMDEETKLIIGSIGLVTAAVAPMLVVFGNLVKVIGVAGPLLSGMATTFGKMIAAINPLGVVIAGLVTTVVGLTGVFMKLREAGVSTSDALYEAFKLFVTGFNNYITKYLAQGISVMLGMLSRFAGLFSEEMERAISNAAASVDGFASGIEAQFEMQKESINQTLATVGSSAGDAFTFGLSTKASEAGEKIKSMFETQDVAGMDIGLAKALEAENKKVDKPLTEIQKKAEMVQSSITNHMTDAFMSISDGADSAEEAFKKMALAIIQDLKRMAIQAAITRSLFPGGGLSGAVAGFASGGLVTGPGSGTSDSIPARLSNGEYVIRASSVRSVGVDFLDAINALGARSFRRAIPGGFADGGEVTVPTAGQGVSVNVTNNGTEKQVTDASYDPETMVVSIVLDDLSRNGTISRAIGGTFGIGRGDFR